MHPPVKQPKRIFLHVYYPTPVAVVLVTLSESEQAALITVLSEAREKTATHPPSHLRDSGAGAVRAGPDIFARLTINEHRSSVINPYLHCLRVAYPKRGTPHAKHYRPARQVHLRTDEFLNREPRGSGHAPEVCVWPIKFGAGRRGFSWSNECPTDLSFPCFCRGWWGAGWQ